MGLKIDIPVTPNNPLGCPDAEWQRFKEEERSLNDYEGVLFEGEDTGERDHLVPERFELEAERMAAEGDSNEWIFDQYTGTVVD